MFIGHSASISQVQFTPLSGHVISCGDAVFIWEFLGLLHPLHPFHPSTPTPSQGHKVTSSLRSASPRKRPPAPVHYEPLKMQTFTPLVQHSLKTKSHGEFICLASFISVKAWSCFSGNSFPYLIMHLHSPFNLCMNFRP